MSEDKIEKRKKRVVFKKSGDSEEQCNPVPSTSKESTHYLEVEHDPGFNVSRKKTHAKSKSRVQRGVSHEESEFEEKYESNSSPCKNEKRVAAVRGFQKESRKKSVSSLKEGRSVIRDNPTNVSRKLSRSRSYVPPTKTRISAILEELCDDLEEDKDQDKKSRYGTRDEYTSAWSQKKPHSSDKMYVQSKRGFIPVVDEQIKDLENVHGMEENISPRRIEMPIEIAMRMQQYTRKFYNLCHGLLGGFGLAHCILIISLGYDDDVMMKYLDVYSHTSGLIHSVFFLLAAICLISVLDRCDIGFDIPYYLTLCAYAQRGDLLLFVNYVFVFVVTVVAVRWDEDVNLKPYGNGTVWIKSNVNMVDIGTWKSLNLCRNVAAIFGWIFLSIFESRDNLYQNLKELLPFQSSVKIS